MMIKLKNGKNVQYNDNFDIFFKNLMEAIIYESKNAALEENSENETDNIDELNELFLKEIMDNCIYVTHQLFEILKTNEDLSKFVVTGFIFNSIMILISQSNFGILDNLKEKEKKNNIH